MHITKKVLYTLLFVPLILYSIPVTVSAEESSEGTQITNLFNTSTNSVERRGVLFSLRKFKPDVGVKAPLWIGKLLVTALKDNSASVVAEAVHQTGEIRLTEYNSNLIQLYKDAEKRFGVVGYTVRIQYAIITALGKIGNQDAKSFIAELLRKDNGSRKGEFLLAAIKDLNDPAFLPDLKLYKAKMQNTVNHHKKRGDDPIMYAREFSYIWFIEEINGSILKGGKK